MVPSGEDVTRQVPDRWQQSKRTSRRSCVDALLDRIQRDVRIEKGSCCLPSATLEALLRCPRAAASVLPANAEPGDRRRWNDL